MLVAVTTLSCASKIAGGSTAANYLTIIMKLVCFVYCYIDTLCSINFIKCEGEVSISKTAESLESPGELSLFQKCLTHK